MILYSMYHEIVFHSHGARMAEKHIEAQIEWANVCIKVANIPKAIQMLESVQLQMKVCWLIWAMKSGFTWYESIFRKLIHSIT